MERKHFFAVWDQNVKKALIVAHQNNCKICLELEKALFWLPKQLQKLLRNEESAFLLNKNIAFCTLNPKP